MAPNLPRPPALPKALVSARDPLDAVPVVMPSTRMQPLASGSGLLLFREEPARGRLAVWCAERLGWRRERAFELDAIGARFVSRIDGERPLSEIQRTLSLEFGLDDPAARRAVVEFTSQLMRCGLVALRFRSEREARGGHGA